MAIKHLTDALTLAYSQKNDFFSVVILTALTDNLLADKQFVKAQVYASQGLELLSSKVNVPTLKRRFLDFLYQANKGQGRWQVAFDYKEKSYALYDSLQDEAILKNGEATEQKITAERKQFETEKLVQIQQQRLNYSIFALVTLLLVVGGLIWYGIHLRKTKKQLEIQNAAISAALLRGQTRECKRVASDLHDNLVAKIAGIRWRFQMIDKGELTHYNTQLYETVEQALTEVLTDVRHISHNLLPLELEQTGLKGALQKLIAENNELQKIKFRLDLPTDFPRLSSKIEFELYNIVLELTTNILRHAQATEAEATLMLVQNGLSLIVTDNGVGLSNSTPKGMGLQNVQTRVEGLNGTFTYHVEKGTKLSITIPTLA